jgi:hypothetical protein
MSTVQFQFLPHDSVAGLGLASSQDGDAHTNMKPDPSASQVKVMRKWGKSVSPLFSSLFYPLFSFAAFSPLFSPLFFTIIFPILNFSPFHCSRVLVPPGPPAFVIFRTPPISDPIRNSKQDRLQAEKWGKFDKNGENGSKKWAEKNGEMEKNNEENDFIHYNRERKWGKGQMRRI